MSLTMLRDRSGVLHREGPVGMQHLPLHKRSELLSAVGATKLPNLILMTRQFSSHRSSLLKITAGLNLMCNAANAQSGS